MKPNGEQNILHRAAPIKVTTIQLFQLARTLTIDRSLARSLAYSIPYMRMWMCDGSTLVYMQYVPIQIADGNHSLNENIYIRRKRSSKKKKQRERERESENGQPISTQQVYLD